MKILKQADCFGVPFVQNIDDSQTKYKSTLGGIITITIFTASLAYVFWIGYLWQTNQMSPKISRQNYISDYSLLDLSEEVVRVYYWQDQKGKIDPFTNNILLPLIVYTVNNTLTQPQLISNHSAAPFGEVYVPKMQFDFSYYDGYIYATSDMYIEIVMCSEIYLKPGEKCASPELKQKFFAQSNNVVQLEFFTTSIDPRDGKKQRGYQEFTIQIEEKYCSFVQSYFKTTLFELQNYFLFGYPQFKEYIVDVLLQTQTNSLEFCQKAYETEAIGIVYLGMTGTQVKTTLEYPRLGDLLANIGSIVSILFMIKYFIIFLNEYFLNQKVLKEIISFYYPEFKNIQIKKNWRGRVTEASLNQIKLDINNYTKFYEKVSSQMQQKFSYLNLLYEISRLYFVMRSSKFRYEFQKSHQIGIKISTLQQKDSEIILTPKSEKDYENNYILNDDDADILSYSRRKTDKIYDPISEELYNEIDYYYANKIL
ncbi:unnamed protein product (macronuclear) [Paramecium tetraurelia]|uniref:Uncharacterized protein n=1 Tax=Paramecium tetraurelia TaxID=5888 RepID=A0C3Z4_PARTE|nr:uncharacterized protein GSPATT00034991001 [Paramecium tetraurelia]CAK65511.1 unnamed protein product [Paramecium tetraurelia]|eukprot:XP_001432908.1 hypothetical protein (macronuclear) [Paramecium tetraurelia strain d4-2]